ncbi:MAG: ATP-binding protein [Clostridiales bacterium]|nr:ATP-binding protein [Clostridiales bacterium]MCD7827728.1 ATP-binding protein [Clostridiales bacterium]
MAYNEKLLRLASDEIDRRKRQAEDDAEKRHDDFASKCPELIMLEDKMKKSAYGLIKVIGMGTDAQKYIEKLRIENLQAQDEIKRLLKLNSLPEDYLEPKYFCSICNDTGFHKGKLCKCHLELLKQLSYEQLCKSSPLTVSTFEDFKLSYYNGDSRIYDLMSRVFSYCKGYAESFDLSSDSICMTGETGLGKTHLSLAIAGEVLKKGYGVIYGSVQNLFGNVEREHFGRSNDPEGTTEKMLLDCDLLILDDLGAEFTTNFTISTLNNIVNTRLLTSKPTIISTNLQISNLDEKYTRRITSRIIGEYRILSFAGKDIRQQRFAEKLGDG